MAYEMVMPYHLHMPSYFLETFTEYPYVKVIKGDYLSEKEIRLLLYNSFLKSSISGKALRSRSGMSLDAW